MKEEKTNKVVTSVLIDPEKRSKVKEMGLSVSDILDRALDEHMVMKNRPGEDPFRVKEVKELLPEAAEAIQRNIKYANGWSKRIYGQTGYYISPIDMVKRLGIDEGSKSGKKTRRK